MLQARSPFRALAKNRAISPPPPSRQGRTFPLCRGNPLCSLRGSLRPGPVELGSIDPHPMQNNGELACNGDLGLAQPVALDEPHPPSLQRRPFRHAGHQYASRFEQVHTEHGVTALRDSARPVDLSVGMPPGRPSDLSNHTSRSLKPSWIINGLL